MVGTSMLATATAAVAVTLLGLALFLPPSGVTTTGGFPEAAATTVAAFLHVATISSLRIGDVQSLSSILGGV